MKYGEIEPIVRLKYIPRVGSQIERVLIEAMDSARTSGLKVELRFNDVYFEVTSESTMESLWKIWSDSIGQRRL